MFICGEFVLVLDMLNEAGKHRTINVLNRAAIVALEIAVTNAVTIIHILIANITIGADELFETAVSFEFFYCAIYGRLADAFLGKLSADFFDRKITSL